jgi:hypothetical protein
MTVIPVHYPMTEHLTVGILLFTVLNTTQWSLAYSFYHKSTITVNESV